MAATAKPQPGAPEEVARRDHEAMAARDLDALMALRHEDVVEDFVPVGIFRGKAESRAYLAELFAAFPDWHLVPGTRAAAGTTVFAGWRASGTHTGAPFGGIDPTAKRIDLRGVDVFEIRDGLIARSTVYYDGLSVGRSLGMLPAQGSGGERAMFAAFNATTRAKDALRDVLPR